MFEIVLTPNESARPEIHITETSMQLVLPWSLSVADAVQECFPRLCETLTSTFVAIMESQKIQREFTLKNDQVIIRIAEASPN